MFIRSRYGGWACLMSLLAAVLLTGRDGAFQAPVTGESVQLPFVWPAASLVPVLMVSRSRMAEWESRALRNLRGSHAAMMVGATGVGAWVVVTLQPLVWPVLVGIALIIQAVGILGLDLFGEWAGIVVAAVGAMTVLRGSWVEATLVYSGADDRGGVTLATGVVAYCVALVVAVSRVGRARSEI